MKTAIVTGAAGFIGSNLTDALLSRNFKVIGIDNLSTGDIRFLKSALSHPMFFFERCDLFNYRKLELLFEGADIVFHLSANADVRFGPDHPNLDFEQNTIVTHRVLEALRKSRCRRMVFSSTGSVYGETEVVPTPENAPFPKQTSLYGASKLAAEGLIQAYGESFGLNAVIFRFVSILGERYTHGHIYDFYQQLKKTPTELNILGDGHQKKSYLHVKDCISAIALIAEMEFSGVEIYNLGRPDACEIRESVSWICDELDLEPSLNFGVDNKGWVGDNPLILLDIEKISRLGWRPRYSIEESVRSTVNFLSNNEWVLTS